MKNQNNIHSNLSRIICIILGITLILPVYSRGLFNKDEGRLNMVRIRLLPGYKITEWLGVFIGPSYNVYFDSRLGKGTLRNIHNISFSDEWDFHAGLNLNLF